MVGSEVYFGLETMMEETYGTSLISTMTGPSVTIKATAQWK